jgi:hypothetical protein
MPSHIFKSVYFSSSMFLMSCVHVCNVSCTITFLSPIYLSPRLYLNNYIFVPTYSKVVVYCYFSSCWSAIYGSVLLKLWEVGVTSIFFCSFSIFQAQVWNFVLITVPTFMYFQKFKTKKKVVLDFSSHQKWEKRNVKIVTFIYLVFIV